MTLEPTRKEFFYEHPDGRRFHVVAEMRDGKNWCAKVTFGALGAHATAEDAVMALHGPAEDFIDELLKE